MLILSFILLATMIVASAGYIITSKPLKELRKQELDSAETHSTHKQAMEPANSITKGQIPETAHAKSDASAQHKSEKDKNKDSEELASDESASSSPSEQPSE